MPEHSTYYQPTISTSAQVKEKGIKFIGFTFPVVDLNEIETHLLALKKQFPDATHHCFAWQIGLSKQQYKAHDDGEPAYSAGAPILGQIRAHHLTNVLVVVVRYFGGVNLGVGGLISAYKTVASLALAQVVPQPIKQTLNAILTFDYAHTNLVNRILHELKIKPFNEVFTETCEWQIALPENELSAIQNRLQILQQKGFSISITVLSESVNR